jgi:transcriptional regulator with XRE-family HTH domain
MSQRTQIVTELKRILRERRLTYAVVAKKLDLSEASVKRWFSTGDFSLERIDRICELAGIEMAELIDSMREHAHPTNQLTLAQEQEVVADPKLFLITWLVLNRWQYAEIVKHYKFNEREALRYFLKLDRLKIIELQPHNKAKLLVSRHFTWRTGGPVQNYIHQKLLREFIDTRFLEARDEFFFHGGVVSEVGLAQLRELLQQSARECVNIMERDRGLPTTRRGGAAYVIALRPWQYSGFAQFLRQ